MHVLKSKKPCGISISISCTDTEIGKKLSNNENIFLLFHHSINISSIRSAVNRATQRRPERRPNVVPLNDINSNQAPLPRDHNQLLSGNQSPSQNSTPRAIQTRSAYM